MTNLPFDFNTIIGIATIFGTIAAWIALWPMIKPWIEKFTSNIAKLTDSEKTYLQSLAKDLEFKNQKNRWSNRFYVEITTELRSRNISYDIPAAFYVVKSINRHFKEQDFNNLSNIEKIDSSRGRSFNSLESALTDAQDNAVVVIAPPGSGKTVSLRNLALKQTKKRLERKTNLVPIFVNLGYYTSFNSDGKIKNFEDFLDELFSASNYQNYLSNQTWQNLLKQSRCIFFLDGIDELPRKPYEYEARCQKIADFVQAWPNTTFILSCRELDYNRELPFQQILIKPFDTKHIKSYMKRYFGESEYQRIFEQIKKLPSIYELCSNPFYLDIICYFSKISDQIPESKTQLFDFIVNQFIDRENQKQMLTMNKNEFMLAISHLAYYLAVQRMTTTVNIDEYTNSIKELKNHELFMKAIGYAIKGDLLEFNENSREIRFIHNRFQEFFSSFHISKNYQKAEAIYPSNFFTNIWWKETVLFVAGFNNDNTDAFINSILDHRNMIEDSNKTIKNLLKLEVTILAFECIANNPFFSNLELYQKIRDSLVDEYYQGDTLVKVKVLNALKNDKAEKAMNLIHAALTDNSLWVSERAFFILTDGQLKMQLRLKSILNEYFRFFIEGRIISVFMPVIRSARKSNLVMMLLPVYISLVIASVLSIGIVGFVFYSFFTFIFFRLEFAFTADCLGCLGTISLAGFIIIYSLLSNNYPFLKKFIYATPLAIMVHYYVFNAPSNLFFRAVMVVLSLIMFFFYTSYFKKPNESYFTVGSLTALMFGIVLPLPIFNYKSLARLIETYMGISVTTSNPLFWLIAFLMQLSILIIYIYFQVMIINRLTRRVEEFREFLRSPRDNLEIIARFEESLNSLPLLWTQKIFLERVLEQMTSELQFSRPQKITILDMLAKQILNIHLKDAIYQILEEEENNFRRSIKISNSNP